MSLRTRRYASAGYMLWHCVCLSVCLSVTSRYCIEKADRAVVADKLLSVYPTLCWKKIRISPKLTVRPSATAPSSKFRKKISIVHQSLQVLPFSFPRLRTKSPIYHTEDPRWWTTLQVQCSASRVSSTYGDLFILRFSFVVQRVYACRMYIRWNDVTVSVVTIRSPFCGYKLSIMCGVN